MVRTNNTRAKDCAPDIEDANRLKVAAGGDVVNAFIIACAMFLAMDKGMIAHWKKEWVKPWEGKMYIPGRQVCDIGPGGKPCAYCMKHGIIENGLVYWHPKGRTVEQETGEKKFITHRNTEPKEYSLFPYTKETIERMVAAYTKFPLTERTINERLDAMAAGAKVKRRITVHGLRSFAIDNAFEIFLGDEGRVCRFVGWAPNSDMAKEYKNDWNYRNALHEGVKRSLI